MTIESKKSSAHVSCARWNAYKGYTLLSPVEGRQVYLVDMEGEPVQTWEIPFALGGRAELLPNGNLLCAATATEGPLAGFEGATGKLVEIDWDSKIVWEYEDPNMHHDFYRLENGNTVVLRWVKTPDDLARSIKGGLSGTESDGVMWSDSIQEINPSGELVWEWLGYEHLDINIDIICPLCFRNEWTHANSLSINEDGDILVSFMKTNTVAIISKKTGDIIWRWGGFLKLAHPSGVSFIGDEDILLMGTSIHGEAFEKGYSEVLMVSTRNNNIIWEFRAPAEPEFYTACKGSLQLLPNGNVLVCEGDSGRIFEVVNNKEIVWEYTNPYYNPSSTYSKNNNMLLGAYRYSPNYMGLKGNTEIAEKFGTTPAEQVKLAVKPKYTSEAEEAVNDRLTHLGY